MSEFICVHLIDKQPVGSNLGKVIPLHMTALHWFSVDADVDEVIDATMTALQSVNVVKAKATKEDLFGPNKDVPVMRLEPSPELTAIHTQLMEAMKELGASFNDRWVGADRWNAHVTHKSDNRLYPGDQVVISDMDLITRPERSGDRTILHRFTLK